MEADTAVHVLHKPENHYKIPIHRSTQLGRAPYDKDSRQRSSMELP